MRRLFPNLISNNESFKESHFQFNIIVHFGHSHLFTVIYGVHPELIQFPIKDGLFHLSMIILECVGFIFCMTNLKLP